MTKVFSVGLIVGLLLIESNSIAQEINFQELQDNIDTFSMVIEEALELDQGAGLFGINVGGVDPIYLYGQGVLLEVRTPLASQRNRLRLTSLNSTMRTLQGENPFERIMRRATPSVMPMEPLYAEANSFYRNMMERIAKIDYSLIISAAIQQASNSARALRTLGDIDDTDFEKLRIEFENMRDSMNENLRRLSQLQEEITKASDINGSNSEEFDLQADSRLVGIEENLESLRTSALARAEELKVRTEVAEKVYVAQWQEDIVTLEENLYKTICNYGATLRALPLDERVSILLKGLGRESEDITKVVDKVHVLLNQDIQRCQNGSMNISELRGRARQYSY
jgi:hypothetical protein